MKIILTTIVTILSLNLFSQELNKKETKDYIEKKLRATAENDFFFSDDILFIYNNFSKHTWKIDPKKVKFIDGQYDEGSKPNWLVIECVGNINCILEGERPQISTMIILNNTADVQRLIKAFNHLKELLSDTNLSNGKDPFD